MNEAERIESLEQQLCRTRTQMQLLMIGFVCIIITGAVVGAASQADKNAGGLLQRVDTLESEVNRLTLTNPPIGTVVAFAGPWPQAKAEKEKWEEKMGWLLCDGRTLEGERYKELRAALKQDELPNYQGLFLRGVQGDQKVGDYQDWSTGKPKDFAILLDGGFDPAETVGNRRFDRMLMIDGLDTVDQRDITAVGFGGKFEANLCDSRPLKTIPKHSHGTKGWDTETRPINRAVHWIIKYK